MASSLIDKTRLGNALARFKTNMLKVAQPKFVDVVIGSSVSIASSSGTNVTITSEMAGFSLTQATIIGVMVQDAWPQESWTNGACVTVTNFGMLNGSLNVTLTTNMAQTYRLGIRVIYLSN